MPSILLKLADLGFTAHGCYREGNCQSCLARNLLTWYWHGRWVCDVCVLNHLFPEAMEVPHGTDHTDRSIELARVLASVEAA